MLLTLLLRFSACLLQLPLGTSVARAHLEVPKLGLSKSCKVLVFCCIWTLCCFICSCSCFNISAICSGVAAMAVVVRVFGSNTGRESGAEQRVPQRGLRYHAKIVVTLLTWITSVRACHLFWSRVELLRSQSYDSRFAMYKHASNNCYTTCYCNLGKTHYIYAWMLIVH